MNARNTEIARDWRAVAEISDVWQVANNQAGALDGVGQSGGLFVFGDEVRRRLYLKPRRRANSRGLAAREKICSDLAQDLGVNVPPVALTKRYDCGADEADAVCVSLVMFRTQYSWEEVRPLMDDAESKAGQAIRRQLPAIARAFAFDCWVGQLDHNDHPHNIVLGFDEDEDEAELVFLDYELACGRQGWDLGRHLECSAAPFPPALLRLIHSEHLSEAVGNIENFPADTVREIVGRVPLSHIGEMDRGEIASRLVERQALVRPALASYLTREI